MQTFPGQPAVVQSHESVLAEASYLFLVIPAEAGIHAWPRYACGEMDSRLRGSDEQGIENNRVFSNGHEAADYLA
jgi:hypothetical protein